MQREGISEDVTMFACVLKACGGLAHSEQAQELHAKAVKKGMEADTMVTNTLVDVYVKCNMLPESVQVFNIIRVRTIVSWNAIIGGYVEHGHHVDAVRCLEQMRLGPVPPDALTLAFSLKAYGSIGDAIKECWDVHTEICCKGLEKDTFLGNALIEMYAKTGLVTDLHQIFNCLLTRDAVSWTSLIMAYYKRGNYSKCLECFHQMRGDGISPDAVTYVCCVKACGSLGCIATSEKIHAMVVEGRLEKDAIIGSCLIDMYASCGLVTKAQEVFDMLQVRSVVSWNASSERVDKQFRWWIE
jgi:pentatricopeptide repeat protein